MEKMFILKARDFKFGDLLWVWKLTTNAKFQLSFSKSMPARTYKHLDMGVNTTIVKSWQI